MAKRGRPKKNYNLTEMTRKCLECGARMTFRSYDHVEKVGSYKVKDGTAFAWQCPKCSEVELTLDELAGYQRRAAAIVLREAKRVDGAIVKYARRALGLTVYPGTIVHLHHEYLLTLPRSRVTSHSPSHGRARNDPT